MIHGIGTDLCEIARMAKVLERQGDGFAQKVLGPLEWPVFVSRQQPRPERAHAYLATRFAAKEAFCKATGLGFREPFRWHDMQVVSDALGRPSWTFSGPTHEWMTQRGLIAHLSLSDEAGLAMAFVTLEQRAG